MISATIQGSTRAAKSDWPEIIYEFNAMGGPCALRITGAETHILDYAARKAVEEVRRIEQKYSRYLPESWVSRVNNEAGTGKLLEVDEETSYLLDFADNLHRHSDGCFDITSGVLSRAWNFRKGLIPSREQINALLPLVNWKMVCRQQGLIALIRKGMEIDFGGIGKEYAADRACACLRNEGVSHGYINLAGDISLVGPQPDGAGWILGIRDPRRDNAMMKVMELGEGALATSGNYERYVDCSGIRYGHVLDARTGWPVNNWQSISVVGPSCTAAGAVCTLAMMAGDATLPFLRDQGLPFVALDSQGAVFESVLEAA